MVAATVALGCGGAPGDGPDEPRGTGEVFVVAAGEDATPSGAFQARLGVYPLNVNVGETLVRMSRDFEVEPALATDWEYRGSGTWRFRLREGVRFHDGSPLDAEAVRWNMAQIVAGGFGYGSLTERSTVVVDSLTVDVTTTEPDLRLPQRLVHPNYSLFARGSNPGREPVGTGPFRFVEYRPDERMVVERNEEYWGEPARPGRLIFRFFPDPATRVLALLSGEVDLVMDVPREQVGALEKRVGFELHRAPVGRVLAIQVNAHGEPPHDLLADRAVRRAVALAIDRSRLVETVLKGEAEAVQNMTVPAVLGDHADDVEGYPYAPDSARGLLEASGWVAGRDGIRRRAARRLRLALLSDNEISAATVEFVQANLRAVGIEARWLRLPDVGSYSDRLVAGEFDLNLALPNQNDANPLFLPALLFRSSSDRPFSRWYAVGPRFDRIVEAGLAAPDDEEARRRAAEAIQMALEEANDIPLAGLFRIYATRAGIDGFDPHPSQTHQTWTSLAR